MTETERQYKLAELIQIFEMLSKDEREKVFSFIASINKNKREVKEQ